MKVIKNEFQEIAAKMKIATDDIARKTAFDIQGSIIDSMSGQKSGRIYNVQGKRHQASAPGEPPARDTGNLARSVSVTKQGNAHYIIGVGAEYAIPLEFGSGRIAARPFARPAAKKHKPAFMAALSQLESRMK